MGFLNGLKQLKNTVEKVSHTIDATFTSDTTTAEKRPVSSMRDWNTIDVQGRYEKIAALEKEYKAIVKEYYALVETIGMQYSVINNTVGFLAPEADKCVTNCEQAILLIPQVQGYYQKQQNIHEEYDSSYQGSTPQLYMPFLKLCQIYEKKKEYSSAIAICQKAMQMGIVKDGTEGGFPGRMARMMKKNSSATSQSG